MKHSLSLVVAILLIGIGACKTKEAPIEPKETHEASKDVQGEPEGKNLQKKKDRADGRQSFSDAIKDSVNRVDADEIDDPNLKKLVSATKEAINTIPDIPIDMIANSKEAERAVKGVNNDDFSSLKEVANNGASKEAGSKRASLLTTSALSAGVGISLLVLAFKSYYEKKKLLFNDKIVYKIGGKYSLGNGMALKKVGDEGGVISFEEKKVILELSEHNKIPSWIGDKAADNPDWNKETDFPRYSFDLYYGKDDNKYIKHDGVLYRVTEHGVFKRPGYTGLLNQANFVYGLETLPEDDFSREFYPEILDKNGQTISTSPEVKVEWEDEALVDHVWEYGGNFYGEERDGVISPLQKKGGTYDFYRVKLGDKDLEVRYDQYGNRFVSNNDKHWLVVGAHDNPQLAKNNDKNIDITEIKNKHPLSAEAEFDHKKLPIIKDLITDHGAKDYLNNLEKGSIYSKSKALDSPAGEDGKVPVEGFTSKSKALLGGGAFFGITAAVTAAVGLLSENRLSLAGGEAINKVLRYFERIGRLWYKEKARQSAKKKVP